MAETTTTTSSAVLVGDASIKVTSATGAVAGAFLKCDGEVARIQTSYVSGTTIPVIRGVEGTVTAAHVSGANVTFMLASDMGAPVAGVENAVTYPANRGRTITSYGAAGAIALPTPGTDAVAIINGTVALAMTLANPTKDQDGDILYVIGNGKAAHTITYTAGLGNAGAALDVGTFATGGQLTAAFIAANGIWNCLPSFLGGTQTANTITWA